MRFGFLLLFYFTGTSCFAQQKEGAVWIIGRSQINFLDVPPTVIRSLSSKVGNFSASICNPIGELQIFFTGDSLFISPDNKIFITVSPAIINLQLVKKPGLNSNYYLLYSIL